MGQFTIIQRNGEKIAAEGVLGVNLMKLMRDAGAYEILALCGGGGSCATCHIYVEPKFFDALPAPSEDENDMLDSSDHRRPHSRLACQVIFAPPLDGVTVEIAPQE